MEAYCMGGVAVDEWRSKIGGGLDFQREVFLSLLERIEARAVVHLLMVHKDRLCRFGSDWFAFFADTHGCEIRVVNQPSLSPQVEWVEDLMVVVDSFSGRLPGLRRYRKRIREAAVDG